MKRIIFLALTSYATLLASDARAAQAGSTHYLQGTYTDFSGMPPAEPGFYLANYFVDYHNGTFSASRELPLGAIFAAGVNVNLQAGTPIAIYAYPFTLDGITFSSGIAVPFVWVDVEARATFNISDFRISGRREQSVSGLGDIQLMPLMAGWSKGDFKLGGMFNVWAPTGDYTPSRLANQGLGYWTFEPMLAFSWLSSKIGTELSVFTALDFNTTNNTVDYHSGDVFHVDATLAQHLPLFGGIGGVGASVFYVNRSRETMVRMLDSAVLKSKPMGLAQLFPTCIRSESRTWLWTLLGCPSYIAITRLKATISGLQSRWDFEYRRRLIRNIEPSKQTVWHGWACGA